MRLEEIELNLGGYMVEARVADFIRALRNPLKTRMCITGGDVSMHPIEDSMPTR